MMSVTWDICLSWTCVHLLINVYILLDAPNVAHRLDTYGGSACHWDLPINNCHVSRVSVTFNQANYIAICQSKCDTNM
jgi:hypothetical protein